MQTVCHTWKKRAGSIMATTDVYSPTTAPNPKTSWCLVPSKHLDKIRFLVKTGAVLLSFVAFILEEVVSSCISCSALYFFEFVSCTAFLFTLLLLVLLSTTLHTKVGIDCWPKLDITLHCGHRCLVCRVLHCFLCRQQWDGGGESRGGIWLPGNSIVPH
ncbi:hypothetical protein Q5P01_011851 [Channa striata]|uniref:MARVEL domain-containing protein n=1 Tax=Channa striata TaxID=64152 RepID=A0AA88N095_CHASR|nr:hypothetical protein Q5P01_011851 [Channa striata]